MGEPKIGKTPRLAVVPDSSAPIADEKPIAPKVPLGPVEPLGRAALVPPMPSIETAILTEDGRVDGKTWCASVLAQIRDVKRRDPTQRCVVVFDLDNTLFDTRARTLAVLHAFDESHGTSWFADLDIEDVGWSGRETCGQMGVPEDVTALVDDWWEEHFWNGKNFGEDLVMTELFDLAWEAKRAGAEIRYLTGRIDRLKSACVEQVKGAGLPDADDEHMFCKPNLDTKTGPFKFDRLAEWVDDGAYLGWFLTDSRHEIESIRTKETENEDLPALPVGHVEHPLQRAGVVSLDTPTFLDAAERTITPEAARRRAKRFQPRRPRV